MSASASATLAPAARALAPQQPASSTVPANPHAPSLTQKTWVVPPRPKPGRKPATDTPASKRKAQNRVAQRAFRERKAAKVGDLEDQMNQLSHDHQSEVDQLRGQLRELTARLDRQLADGVQGYGDDVRRLQLELDRWKAGYEHERKLREGVEKELAILKGEMVALPRRAPGSNAAAQLAYGASDELPLGCGRCSLTHCQCLEEALNDGPLDSSVKRPISPSVPDRQLEKRPRSGNDDPNGFDTIMNEPATMDSAADQCGFCKDGTTCLCAELAAERKRADAQPSSLPSPPGEEYSHAPPQPTEIDFTTSNLGRPCPSGPGTCQQCRSDPTSKGFCKGLAAMKPSTSSTKSAVDTISCAKAFSTLKQHPAFGQASKNFSEWLPQLATVPRPGQDGRPDAVRPSYTAFEIESASVLGVLKFFDRKFGMEP